MKKLSPSFKDCEAFIQNAPVACLSLNRGGTILALNPAADRLAEGDGTALPGRSIDETFSRADLLHRRLRSRGEVDSSEEIAGILTLPSGRALSVGLCLQRLRTGPRRLRYFAWVRDRRELEELKSKLEHSEKLSAMAIVAGKVAHEIRTPLNSIFLNNDLLQARVDRMRGAQGKKLKRYVSVLQEEVERLNEVVRSYLSLARLVGSDRQPTEVQAFLEDFINEVRGEYAERRITIATAYRTPPRELSLNRRQFRRVMLNIFANSRDAMPNLGVITVSTEEGPGSFRITVSDNGDGIAPESLTHLTTPFTSFKVNGSGLGLYLVREIVERHGGQLDIQSVRREGTSVIITLPLEEAAATA
jgi:signal transduction histidine kinase